MAWLDLLPSYASRFHQRGWQSSAAFLDWTGILVNRHRHRQVEWVTLDSDSFYLKKEHAVTWRDRLRNAWHGFGWCATATREARLLQSLRTSGIACPEVVAHGEVGRQAFLLLRDETGMNELRVLLPTLGDASERNRLADALGRELARMHNAGFEHPDLSAKHILIAREDDDFRFCVLDWQRGRRRRTVNWNHRCRDLALLDATLHESLASDRLRLRFLRAYRRATGNASPLAGLAKQIRRQAELLRHKRNIREIGQLAVPAKEQQLTPMENGRLFVVRSFHEQHGGRIPEAWKSSVCSKNAAEHWEFPDLAHTLFRLHRFGVPAPRLLAVDANNVFTACSETISLAQSLEWVSAAERDRLLWEAGRTMRKIHEAGYRLSPGESWQQRLGVQPDGQVILANAASLCEDRRADGRTLLKIEWPKMAFLISSSDRRWFLRGYLQRPAWNEKSRRRIRSPHQGRERLAVS